LLFLCYAHFSCLLLLPPAPASCLLPPASCSCLLLPASCLLPPTSVGA